jgi:hypothetical protein
MKLEEEDDWNQHQTECMGCSNHWPEDESDYKCFRGKILAPYYPAIENQHDVDVLLVKNEVSSLKKEDFGK